MEDDLPRRRGSDSFGAASQLSSESLDSYSQDELIERITLLETEIARVKAHHDRAAQRRKLAEALFSPDDGPPARPGDTG